MTIHDFEEAIKCAEQEAKKKAAKYAKAMG